MLRTPVRLFAYPFSGRDHISPRSRELVREAGFECCVACYGGVNSGTPDPFNLNRIGMAEWFGTPDQFGFEFLAGRASSPGFSIAILFFLQLTPGRVAGAEMWAAVPARCDVRAC